MEQEPIVAKQAKNAAKLAAKKRVPSAYNEFIKESYAPYKGKFPDAKPKDVMKALAEQWKAAKTPK